MLHLVRLVVDDDWSPASAGERLREATDDDAVLRRVHARVTRTLIDRRSTSATVLSRPRRHSPSAETGVRL